MKGSAKPDKELFLAGNVAITSRAYVPKKQKGLLHSAPTRGGRDASNPNPNANNSSSLSSSFGSKNQYLLAHVGSLSVTQGEAEGSESQPSASSQRDAIYLMAFSDPALTTEDAGRPDHKRSGGLGERGVVAGSVLCLPMGWEAVECVFYKPTLLAVLASRRSPLAVSTDQLSDPSRLWLVECPESLLNQSVSLGSEDEEEQSEESESSIAWSVPISKFSNINTTWANFLPNLPANFNQIEDQADEGSENEDEEGSEKSEDSLRWLSWTGVSGDLVSSHPVISRMRLLPAAVPSRYSPIPRPSSGDDKKQDELGELDEVELRYGVVGPGALATCGARGVGCVLGKGSKRLLLLDLENDEDEESDEEEEEEEEEDEGEGEDLDESQASVADEVALDDDDADPEDETPEAAEPLSGSMEF